MDMTTHDHPQHQMPGPHTEHNHHAAHAGAHTGHAGGHADHAAQFGRLFAIMSVLAVPTVFASMMFASIVGYDLPEWPWLQWVSPILGTVMFGWGGKPFLVGAVGELRGRKPGMMTLIALAISVAFVASWLAALGVVAHDLDFWWELALLIVIMLAGHWIEMRSLAMTTSALDSLAALLPDEAERLDGDVVETVAPTDLRIGDVVIVRPGGRVPADGEIIDGAADFDESMITGESTLVRRAPGDVVVAGTVAADTAVRVRIAAVGDDTALSGIARLVEQAQNSTSRAQRLADRAAGWLFWFALASAAITAVVWTALGQPDNAIIRTITVLVIACPHALGLAIPLVVAIATERAAKMGVLVKDRVALETLRNATVVLFDKTGTLTRGEPAVVDVRAASGWNVDDVIELAAAAERDSEHPLARAVVDAAELRKLRQHKASGFVANAAVGVQATVDGRDVAVGGPNLLAQESLSALDEAQEWIDGGTTVLHVVVDGEIAGALALADEIRPESAEAITALRAKGIEPVMITGDAPSVAHRVAAQLGIDRVYAGVRPEDKESKVAQLQSTGATVVMVGDGVNDAPALARADVGVAIGAGTDVAIGSAGVILAGDDPRAVVSAISLSAASYRKMKQNLWWAAGYNLVAVPLAAGVLAPIGFVMPMAVGAILMSASTVIVALNAQLLRRSR
ncbi:heavy metal translocating P-type ATPase [Gordonia sp. TBRC 11910]|uniref:Heavy metal translocating P-type ATPase n=2 Tax=Gordonia asplenii TaxID=2725283 RepID=A0A848KXU8_9ACTN|nr:heavy metal translocating P-type ATPase [Gordonia asplenii]